MRRLPAITQDKLTPEQKDLFDKITSGPRSANRSIPDFLDGDGGLRGPFNALLYRTAIGDLQQQMGAQLRFSGVLPGDMREVAIMTVGQVWQADYEFYAHAKAGRKENVSEDDIEAIRQGKAPSVPALAATHAFTVELLENRKVGDAAYKAVHDIVGDDGMVELVILIGFYCMVSANLNAFLCPMPEGVPAPFGTV
ncbi:MAG: hypothetical protein VW268_13745 [Rhodospirillaceae bacterium]